MRTKGIESLLSDFIKSQDWTTIKEVIKRIKCLYFWIMDVDGKLLYTEGEICPGIAKGYCQRFIRNGFFGVKKDENHIVNECEERALGFFSPIILNNQFMGVIGGCRITSYGAILGYRKIVGKTKRKGLIESEETIVAKEILLQEARLIGSLASSSLKILFKDIVIREKEDEFSAISESYKIFSGEFGVAKPLGKQNLCFIIVDLVARVMGAEICSMMIIDRKTEEMRIESAVGLDPIIMSRTKIKVGEGIAGYVARTGKPLLIEDIDNDPRFKHRSYQTNRYYTKSLLCAPLQIDHEIFGVVSVNNKVSRESFCPRDLETLTLLLSRIVQTADGEIVPFSIKLKETSDLVMQNEASIREIEGYKALIASVNEEKRILEEKIISLEHAVEREKGDKQNVGTQEDVEYLKELVKRGNLKVQTMEEEILLLREALKKKEHTEISKIEEDVIESFKQEAMALLDERKEKSELVEELEAEREKGRELSMQLEKLKMEKVKDEVAMLKKQKEMIELIGAQKTQKPKDELEELSAQKERIEMLYRVKQRMEEVANLYEGAKQIKDKKAEAVHKETLERLRRQADELEELRAQTKELTFLYKLSSTLANLLNEDEIFEKTIKAADDYFGYDIAGYIILKGKKFFGMINAKASYPTSRIIGLKRRMLNDWLNWNPIRNPKVKRLIETKIMGEKEQIGGHISSYLSSPIREKGKAIGVLFVASEKRGAFSHVSSNILSILTEQVSMAVERARLFLREEELATKDELTGVWNYRYFNETLEREVEMAKKKKFPLVMIMLDFDRLKYVNDTFGHYQGNRLIKTIAHLIEGGVREGDIVGRFGGDEFGIILPNAIPEIGYNVAERVRKRIASHKIVMGQKPFGITVSLGVSCFPHNGTISPSDLLKFADTSLYKAKELGRDRVVMAEG